MALTLHFVKRTIVGVCLRPGRTASAPGGHAPSRRVPEIARGDAQNGGGGVEVATMRIGKTIGSKLYWGFGGILVVVAVLSVANLVALFYEQGTRETYKRLIEMSRQTSEVEQAVLNSGLHLRNYLLGNGDTHEADLLTDSMNEVDRAITKAEGTAAYLKQGEAAKQLLEQVRTIQKDWGASFAAPLVEKRRQLDLGNVTMSELGIGYIQAKSEQEKKTKVEEALAKLNAIMTASLAQADNSDHTASLVTYVLTIVGTLVMVIL